MKVISGLNTFNPIQKTTTESSFELRTTHAAEHLPNSVTATTDHILTLLTNGHGHDQS